jgi:hypothetical protein
MPTLAFSRRPRMAGIGDACRWLWPSAWLGTWRHWQPGVCPPLAWQVSPAVWLSVIVSSASVRDIVTLAVVPASSQVARLASRFTSSSTLRIAFVGSPSPLTPMLNRFLSCVSIEQDTVYAVYAELPPSYTARCIPIHRAVLHTCQALPSGLHRIQVEHTWFLVSSFYFQVSESNNMLHWSL